MIFTKEEQRLYILYYSGSIIDTVDTLHLALRHIYDPDERAVVKNILRKLDETDKTELEKLGFESEEVFDAG